MTEEVCATLGPWGFALADVRVPVHWWHGDRDGSLDVPRFVVDGIPDAQLTVYPGEAHGLDEAHHADWLAFLTAW